VNNDESGEIVDDRRGLGFKQLVAWLVILGLIGLVAYLMAERNSRRYFLVMEGGALAVKRGLFFPVGMQAFKSSDPALLETYGPVTPPPGVALPSQQTFDERSALDQALYDLLARWARADIATENPERLERGLGYLARADRLAGVSAAQREDLRALRAESGFFEARQLIEHGSAALRGARDKLRLAEEAPTGRARDASELRRRIEPLVDEVNKVARAIAIEPAPRSLSPPEPSASPLKPDPGKR
jgi:hypothetical protein